MPLLQIKTNLPSSPDELIDELHKQGRDTLAKELKKSTRYVMVSVEFGSNLSFSENRKDSCAYMEVKNVGKLSPVKTSALSKRLTSLCSNVLGIEPGSIYIEFQQSERHMWGWNGNTFA